jgi:hypothetical protein
MGEKGSWEGLFGAGEPLMKTQVLFFLISVVVGSLPGIPSARPEEGPRPLTHGREAPEPGPEIQMMIEFRDNLLSVRIHHAPWDRVVKELARRTGVAIHVMGPLVGTVSQEFAALPLEEGLARLFGDADFLFSAPREGRPGNAASRSTQAWVYPKEGGGGGQAHPLSPGLEAGAQAEAAEAGTQLAAVAPVEAGSEAPAEQAVIQEELPGTEIWVREDAPASEVEVLGEEGRESEQSFAGRMAGAQAEAAEAGTQLAAAAPVEAGSEAPAEQAVIQEELPGTEIWVREDAPASEVEILGDEQPEME